MPSTYALDKAICHQLSTRAFPHLALRDLQALHNSCEALSQRGGGYASSCLAAGRKVCQIVQVQSQTPAETLSRRADRRTPQEHSA